MNPPLCSKEKTAFYKAGIIHSTDESMVALLRRSPYNTREKVSDHEKLWRNNYEKRAASRELLSAEINKLSPSEKEDLIIECHRTNMIEWEERERKINKLFID